MGLKLLGAQRCLLVAATTYFSSLSFKLVLKCGNNPEMFVYLELGY